MANHKTSVEVIQSMHKDMQSRGFEKFEENPSLALACMVDPTIKYIGFTNSEKAEDAAHLLMTEARKVVIGNQSSLPVFQSSLPVVSESTSKESHAGEDEDEDGAWFELQRRSTEAIRQNQRPNMTSDEEVTDAYLSLQNLPLATDPLKWYNLQTPSLSVYQLFI